jgi:hypothetical protein
MSIKAMLRLRPGLRGAGKAISLRRVFLPGPFHWRDRHARFWHASGGWMAVDTHL